MLSVEHGLESDSVVSCGEGAGHCNIGARGAPCLCLDNGAVNRNLETHGLCYFVAVGVERRHGDDGIERALWLRLLL